MNKAIMIAALAALLSFVWLPRYTRDDTAQLSADKLYCGQRKFSVNLLHSLKNDQPNESLFFSPHSMYRALLLVYFGAKGETEKSLKKTLQLDWADSKADVIHAYKLEKLARANRRQNQTVVFNSVDKFYFSNQLNLKDGVKKMFDDSIEAMNFAFEPEESRAKINKFIEEVTQNNIKNFFPFGSIDHLTYAVLANVAFFKGDWASKFQENKTQKKIFYSRNPVHVDMMRKSGIFNYGKIEELDTNIVEIPYHGENGSISMLIFLPGSTGETIDEFLEKLKPEMLDEVLDGGLQPNFGRAVDIELPKMSFERTFDLRSILSHMGVGNLLEKNADLSEFLEKQPLEFNEAVHYAKIKVDEGGSVAAAVTLLRIWKTSAVKFICNRPFMFLIHDKKSKEILFVGVYRGPNH